MRAAYSGAAAFMCVCVGAGEVAVLLAVLATAAIMAVIVVALRRNERAQQDEQTTPTTNAIVAAMEQGARAVEPRMFDSRNVNF